MNIAFVVLALALLASGLVIAGIGLILGTPSALIATGLFVFGAAYRLQKVMTPHG